MTDSLCQDCDSPLDSAEPLEGSYFVSTYPPFSVWTEAEIAACEDALARPPAHDRKLGLYLHVPFCIERCRYCYYLSYADPDPPTVERYLDALAIELERLAHAPYLRGRSPTFLYFGGGTPSLLSPKQIERLTSTIRTSFEYKDAIEVTFECAPQTATIDRLAALRKAGVTRISMGVQQLDDDVLRASGRVHLVHDVEQAWPQIRTAGFDVVNLDLIVGLANETDDRFFASLERVIDLGPESVTIYQLEIPLNTPLYKALRDGQTDIELADWPTKRERLSRAFDRLEEAGYAIRSAYSAVRDPERHRFVYQDEQYRGADLLGIGASSFSFLGGVHHQNQASLRRYLEAVERGQLPIARAHVLDDAERAVRSFVLQLKLGSVDLAALRDDLGFDARATFGAELDELARSGWITHDQNRIAVTRAGLPFVDRMIPRFYLEQHKNVRYS
jgi:oxygen-independent coproporphyrinogen-3 oxidase